MNLPDLNLLIYAVSSSSVWHRPARRWWEGELNGRHPVGLAWAVLLGFVRLSTRSSVLEHPLSSDQALDLVDGWLARPNVVVVVPGGQHAGILRRLLRSTGTAGNLTTDAHLAALAIEHRAVLHSADRDFARFAGLQWTNPLADPGAD